MFPTEPIRRYIQLSFAKKIDETATAYQQEVVQIRLKMSPNSGMYFQALMDAGVRMQKSKVDACIAIVREACREANSPVDNEVRAYMLGEIHHMCESGKGDIARALANEVGRAAIKPPDNLLPALMAQTNARVSAIESEIAREFKIEELKEGVKRSSQVANPVEAKPLAPVPIPAPVVERTDHAPKSGLTRDQKINIAVGVTLGVLTVVAIIVALTTPEIRRRLKLDKTPDVPQQFTVPEQNPAKTVSGPESNDGDTSSKSLSKPSTPTSPVDNPTPSRGSQPANGGRRRQPPNATPCTMKSGTYYSNP
jgi:hypothetical protein